MSEPNIYLATWPIGFGKPKQFSATMARATSV